MEHLSGDHADFIKDQDLYVQHDVKGMTTLLILHDHFSTNRCACCVAHAVWPWTQKT